MSDDNGHATGKPEDDHPLLDYWGAERSDLRLLERALKQGWPITPEMRQMVVDRTSKVAAKSRQARNIIAAAKVLVQMDMANVSRERMALDKSPPTAQHVHYEYHKHQLTEEEYRQRAKRLEGLMGENGTDKPSANGSGGGNGQSS